MGWPARDTRLALVGRFLPPTTADDLALSFVAAAADAPATIAIVAHPADSITVERRREWLRALSPAAEIIDGPSAPADGMAVSSIPDTEFAARIRRAAHALVGPGLRDRALARAVSLPYVPVDVPWAIASSPPALDGHDRSAGRQSWAADNASVRRVVVMGPESTGKTTLARDLANHYGSVWVGEYLRLWLDAKGAVCEPEDLPPVVAGQRACEEALARRANRVLFSDTDPLMTAVYSRFYYGTLPAWLDEAASARRADAYLLLDCDVPWVPDPQRDMPHRRDEIRDLCREELERRRLPWHLVRGSWAERLAAACRVVDDVLG